MSTTGITIADLDRLGAAQSPDFAAAIITLAKQPFPTRDTPWPDGAIPPDQLMSRINSARWAFGKVRRREGALDVWRKFLHHPEATPPERFALADYIVALYEKGDSFSRQAVITLANEAPLVYGLWAGLKRVYKLSEQRMDAPVWGALTARFDCSIRRYDTNEISRGTMLYLRRRAWRYLRGIGMSTPAIYPGFASAVLRHYRQNDNFNSTWIGTHVVAGETKNFGRRNFEGRLPTDLSTKRAFGEAWKDAPEVLMELLETTENDSVAQFCIDSLKKDAADRLRNVTPAWLARLGSKPLESVQEFLIDTLNGSPDFHKSKLKGLGLHDVCMSLLLSESDKVRKWAIDYGRAHGADLNIDLILSKYFKTHHSDTRKFLAEIVTARKPKDIGLRALAQLMDQSETQKWATDKLNTEFDRNEFSQDFLVEMAFTQTAWLSKWYESKFGASERDPALWIAVLKDKRAADDWSARNNALTILGKLPLKTLPTDWVLQAIADSNYSGTVAGWIAKADALPGLDIEKVKGLVFNPEFRSGALSILANRKLVKAQALGLSWLLALARRTDPALRTFALRSLLEDSKPEDFGDSDKVAGVAKLFKLAREDKDEPVRTFAQTYLRCHHPEIGKAQAESKEYGIKPQLKRDAYTLERLWPFFAAAHEDARSFAVTIAKCELRQWKALNRLYALADHEDATVRRFGCTSLLATGDKDAAAEHTMTLDELDAASVFALTESRRRATRDVGMSLIQQHYQRLGGADKLGRIMESADRDVRQFAVRLLWNQHRPRSLTPGWKPKAKGSIELIETTRFADVEAVRNFLRQLLFGLPPGRSGEAAEVGRKNVAASVAKANVIEVVRDLALEDESFAKIVAPVLGEFTGSIAKGEWQACLAALARLHSVYPHIALTGQVSHS
jgi:hypothetical protein